MRRWGGLPLVVRLSDATPRCRVRVVGRLVWAEAGRFEGGRAYLCRLDDCTGQIDMAFTGRSSIPGLVVGVWCRVEGTARVCEGRLTVCNPDYELRLDQDGGRGS